MKVSIQPSILTGNIFAPASKSSMQRACAAALIRNGESIIHNPGVSNDDKAALDIIQKLGAELIINNEELIIKSSGVNPKLPPSGDRGINCGESGLSIRMFTPIVALSNEAITIDGKGSLLTRPMDFFDEILPQLSVEVKSNQGKLPLQIKGPIQPKNITVDGSLSSQFLTGLLMAYAGANASNVSINVINLKSKPYIDLTLEVMKQFGLNVPVNNNYESFTFHNQPINQLTNQPINYTVEGDWSGAAFLLVAGAIAAPNRIFIKGLDVFSTQADKAILQALMDCGCSISVQPEIIEVGLPASGIAGLKAFQFNATDCPDLFPPLVALAAYCNGTTVIEGVSRLAHKESNRGLTLQEEFAKMGIEIILQDDLMLVKGGTGVNAAIVHSRHDHRIAMASAVAALQANGNVEIEEAESINKSYPNFYDHLQKLGATVQYS
ncbi:MAG TPA: 3-phosphoshikimate 1-carboxyvinyltransferase [Chitinophagaceae bacterium]|jgi:3-phosphoshikimate 1-carboxyvinyltransferase|nr:3-phosphoshikimate 1-carboxyvinyltransferase [Chitinophagaceae bacterium]